MVLSPSLFAHSQHDVAFIVARQDSAAASFPRDQTAVSLPSSAIRSFTTAFYI
jgi:hypothetical protein